MSKRLSKRLSKIEATNAPSVVYHPVEPAISEDTYEDNQINIHTSVENKSTNNYSDNPHYIQSEQSAESTNNTNNNTSYTYELVPQAKAPVILRPESELPSKINQLEMQNMPSSKKILNNLKMKTKGTWNKINMSGTDVFNKINISDSLSKLNIGSDNKGPCRKMSIGMPENFKVVGHVGYTEDDYEVNLRKTFKFNLIILIINI